MIKPLSEKEKNKLNELLQANILSNSRNEKRDKPKSLKYINTDIFTNNKKDIIYRNRPIMTYTSFYQNYAKGNKNSRKLSYKPRRLVKLTGGEIPLKSLGKATLDYTKTFYKMEGDDFDKKLASTGKKNKAFNPIENDITNINNNAEFKAASGIKLAHNSNSLYKLRKNIDIVSENRKRNYEELINKILKLLEIQSHLFFLYDIEEDNNSSSRMTTTFNTLSSLKSNTLNFQSNSLDNNNNKISIKMRKIISLNIELGSSFYKFMNLIFTELREKHNENIRLIKKCNEQEIRINQTSKELETLKNYYNRYDVNAKIYLQQGKESSIRDVKDKFNKKENEYILNIYKLEDEIRNLIFLLDKNKDYYNKLKETEKLVEKSKKQNDEMKSFYNKEIHEIIIKNANEKDREEELNNKMHDLEEIINKLKEEQEGTKRKEIESNAKIKKIKMIINERNENICMLNEELEWYIREYQKEKFNHNNTKTALQILENRIFKDDDKTDKEKSKKEESDDNNENNKNKSNSQKEENNEVIKLNLNISNETNQ